MVPFEHIGEGQVGRLVYQVIGQNGPIFNPTKIIYLDPDKIPISPTTPFNMSHGLTGLNAGLAGVNFMCSVGNLALSAAILSEMREIARKIDALTDLQIAALSRLDWIKNRLISIHLDVAEILQQILQEGSTSSGMVLMTVLVFCRTSRYEPG